MDAWCFDNSGNPKFISAVVSRIWGVVVSLNESTMTGYQIPFPAGGEWREVFNSDVYDNWVNPNVAGNGGRIEASAPGLNGLAASAALVIPANSFLVFTQS